MEPAAYGEVGRGSPGGSSDVCRPSARRFQGIGERDVVSVREEAHDWFWITGDVDTECVTECLDDITQVIALGRPAVGVPVTALASSPSRRYTWVAGARFAPAGHRLWS